MVLEKGRIVEFDTPSNLSSNENGYFYSMVYARDVYSNKNIRECEYEYE
jgi:hypothetical protein